MALESFELGSTNHLLWETDIKTSKTPSYTDHTSANDSACANTSSVADVCSSGGYLNFRKIVFTINWSFARTDSLTAQSTLRFVRSLMASSFAISTSCASTVMFDIYD
jgi:hypothetical protein